MTLALLLAAPDASAKPSTLAVECPALAREEASQVEARVLASLFASEPNDAALRLTCQELVATAELDWQGRTFSHRVAANALGLREAMLFAVESVLIDVATARAEVVAPAAAANAPPTVAEPAARPVEPEKQAAPPPAQPPSPQPTERVESDSNASAADSSPSAPAPSQEFLLRAAARFEDWRSRRAWGGALAVERSNKLYWYGLVIGATAGETPAEAFRAYEGSAGVELGVKWASLGVGAGVSAGMSWLLIEPTSNTLAQSSTNGVAAYFELEVTRPLWFRDVAVVPGAGVRTFSAARSVSLDGDERLRLLGPLLHLTLGVRYRLP